MATNMSASGALLARMLIALLSGATFTGFRLDRFSPRELLSRLGAAGPTHLSLAPSVLRRLHAAARGTRALASVVEVATVGEPLRWSDVQRCRELCSPSVAVVNRFGSTEAGIVAELQVGPDEPIGEGAMSVGFPTPGRNLWIAADDGSPAPSGRTGRIVIDGIFGTDGFPLEDLGGGRSRFMSHDLGRVDAHGELWFEGRGDRMAKVGGARVEPSSVEDVLRSISGILDAAVIPLEVAPDEYRLVAYLVVTEFAPDLETIRRRTAEQVVAIAVPFRFHLSTQPLPLLDSGKIDRLRLECWGNERAD